MRLEQHQQALAYCQQAVILHRELGDRHGEAGTWDSIGYAHHRLGQRHEAVACYRRALDLVADLGDRYHRAITLVHLGDTYAELGDPGAAGRTWAQALDILTELQHPDAAQVQAKLERVERTGSGPARSQRAG